MNCHKVSWPNITWKKNKIWDLSPAEDKAGVSAIERAFLWSQIAKEGEVNEPLHTMLKAARQHLNVPFPLWSLWPQFFWKTLIGFGGPWNVNFPHQLKSGFFFATLVFYQGYLAKRRLSTLAFLKILNSRGEGERNNNQLGRNTYTPPKINSWKLNMMVLLQIQFVPLPIFFWFVYSQVRRSRWSFGVYPTESRWFFCSHLSSWGSIHDVASNGWVRHQRIKYELSRGNFQRNFSLKFFENFPSKSTVFFVQDFGYTPVI